ncbi:MAG: T9SS type A sorting domain-containing protein [Bacteroidia bacterium]
MRSILVTLLLVLVHLLPAQNLDIELYDVQVPDSADSNLELQIDARIINHGPSSWTINPNESLMRYALLDSVPDSLDYSTLPIDQEDFNQGAPILLSPGDTLDYNYRLDVSGKGGGKGITVVIWPTRAASILDSYLPNGFYVATSQTPNAFYALNGLTHKGKSNNNGNENENGQKKDKNKRSAGEASLSIYPNPAIKSLTIVMPAANGALSIIDLQGRVVYVQTDIPYEQFSLPVASLKLSPGLYLIRWQKGEMIETDKVWIISH